MKKTFVLMIATILFSFTAVSAKPKYIGMKRAKEIAHKKVKGTIQSSELEKEHGKMIYSFDIRTTKGEIKEVQINAITGAVVEIKTETAADEAKEKAAEKAPKSN